MVLRLSRVVVILAVLLLLRVIVRVLIVVEIESPRIHSRLCLLLGFFFLLDPEISFEFTLLTRLGNHRACCVLVMEIKSFRRLVL